ncbi:MAG: GIY-YIG nuclease family protein [Planctomycetes bacterium]|nr:GIY-YIG nuclease family protein [Planctomycetota bacterium]
MMTNSEEPDNRVKTQVLSQMGFVHLMKFQQLYKIRRSNATGRRKRELAIQLPDKTKMVHTIKTDDPVEIERFLHQRFKNKRGNGEWFKLDHTDVAAFKKRKVM